MSEVDGFRRHFDRNPDEVADAVEKSGFVRAGLYNCRADFSASLCYARNDNGGSDARNRYDAMYRTSYLGTIQMVRFIVLYTTVNRKDDCQP